MKPENYTVPDAPQTRGVTVQRVNLAEEGQARIEGVDVQLQGGTQIGMRPEVAEDKWNVTPAKTTVTVPEGKALNDFLSVDGKSIKGESLYGTDVHAINKPEDIQKLAGKFGVSGNDISNIAYTNQGNRISDMTVEFKEGVHSKSSNSWLVHVLEKQGVVPTGTTFKMGEHQAIHAGAPSLVTNGEKIEALEFGGTHNETGQGFTVKPRADGKTEIVFGRDRDVAGGLHRHVSAEEHVAAKKIASVLGVDVSGEAGVTHNGVKITVNNSIDAVVGKLDQHGIVSQGMAKELGSKLGQLVNKAEAVFDSAPPIVKKVVHKAETIVKVGAALAAVVGAGEAGAAEARDELAVKGINAAVSAVDIVGLTDERVGQEFVAKYKQDGLVAGGKAALEAARVGGMESLEKIRTTIISDKPSLGRGAPRTYAGDQTTPRSRAGFLGMKNHNAVEAASSQTSGAKPQVVAQQEGGLQKASLMDSAPAVKAQANQVRKPMALTPQF